MVSGLKAFDLEGSARGRRRMVERLDRRVVAEDIKSCGVSVMPAEVDARCSHLRHGWYWGTQAFGQKLRELAGSVLERRTPRSRGYQKDAHVREHGELQAEVWLKVGWKAGGLKEADLIGLKGSDPRKLLLADLLWRWTVVSQEWLAEKLEMKSAANVSQQLRRLDGKAALKKVPDELKHFLAKIDAPN